jgi:hypothetical protein
MSIYQVNKLLYLTDNDAAFRKRMKENPEEAIKAFSLTQEEHDALTSGAVGELYQMGVHTFLLNHLSRYELFGVNRDNYLSRIREAICPCSILLRKIPDRGNRRARCPRDGAMVRGKSGWRRFFPAWLLVSSRFSIGARDPPMWSQCCRRSVMFCRWRSLTWWLRCIGGCAPSC